MSNLNSIDQLPPLQDPTQQDLTLPIATIDQQADPVTTIDLTEITTLIQQLLDNHETIMNIQDLIIVFGNLFAGFVLGYYAVKGMVDPWK